MFALESSQIVAFCASLPSWLWRLGNKTINNKQLNLFTAKERCAQRLGGCVKGRSGMATRGPNTETLSGPPASASALLYFIHFVCLCCSAFGNDSVLFFVRSQGIIGFFRCLWGTWGLLPSHSVASDSLLILKVMGCWLYRYWVRRSSLLKSG